MRDCPITLLAPAWHLVVLSSDNRFRPLPGLYPGVAWVLPGLCIPTDG